MRCWGIRILGRPRSSDIFQTFHQILSLVGPKQVYTHELNSDSKVVIFIHLIFERRWKRSQGHLIYFSLNVYYLYPKYGYIIKL